MRALCFLVVFIAVVGVGCGDEDGSVAPPTEAPAWNHDPADASVGPTAWSDLEGFEECASGREQSPVDVAAAVDADLPSLELDYPATPVVVENTGHTIEAVMPETGGPTMTIAGVEYRLLQYHFHAPSEHTLDGRSFPAEVHLVHQAEDGELAVVGVFLEEALPSALADTIVESAPDESGEEIEVEDAPSALSFLGVVDATSAVVDDLYAYDGSLTTPACSEGVRWFVLPESSGISAEAADRLHDLIAGFPSYDGYASNNRSTQPLNERTVRRDAG